MSQPLRAAIRERERERAHEPEWRGKGMDCHIEWSGSKVEHGKLSVGLKPAPDFAFMVEFDGIVDPHTHPQHEGWGGVLLAHGHVVVSDVRLEAAEELRGFLDETVREANRLAAGR